MSVWFKYPSDKDITPGHPGGSSVFAPGAVGGGYPAYGTTLSTGYGVDYETGANAYSNILANFVYTETCDVDTKADGVGGSFIDWANATNIQFKPYGTHIADGSAIGMYPVEVPSGSGTYYASALSDDSEEIHNGTGQAIIIPIGFDHYYSNGTVIYEHNENLTIEVPSGSANLEDDGLTDNYEYQWNGTGGYNDMYINTTGSYYAAGTEINPGLRFNSYNQHMADVPSTSGNLYPDGKTYEYAYYWDGSGGYYDDVTGNLLGSYHPFHQFISDQDCPTVGTSGVGLGYYWDGYGGYIIDNYP
jgi:hypothetical protein